MTGNCPLPLLTLMLTLPLGTAALCLLFRQRPAVARSLALAGTLAVLLIAIGCFVLLPAEPGWLLLEDYRWISALGISIHLGIDGLALLMILLTAFLSVLAVWLSWNEADRPASYFALLLLVETGVLGVFMALDLVLFYICWELMLIPLFFLIGIWGQKGGIAAAMKFFLFSLAGSLLMLLAIVALYVLHGQQTGDYSFALAALQHTDLPAGLEPWLFAAFALAFLIKVPMVPLHSWQADAYSAAPAACSLLLAGILAKTGIYGLVRFALPLFPNTAQSALPLLATLALVGILYGGWIASAQRDLKRLVAYSSLAHLGFIVLGLSAWTTTAVEGALLQMVNHGLTTAALFILIALIEKRAGSRHLDELGGLWSRVPRLSALLLFFGLAALGLPGLNNFVGEILILLGTFSVRPLSAILAASGLLLAAIYMLRLLQGVIWGPTKDEHAWSDLARGEWLLLVPLVLLVLWLGLYPETFLEPLRGPAQVLLNSAAPLSLNGGLP
ncbi:NADH dehydrogenase [Syntrophotalea acetylenivorans]|uniref:NADH dehydrogenase n=1 Tax=Syntrophotalea acetylenivorans TaxID=1842532 RepID=A0A1L3GQ15_9BACT|nr:NADH-quinone oxidoreductase subunit M [Syntrophotalea acetylenivorans]APG28022.1 NADH dehydrogenase [Syntrophotalea acetylenivorans]